MINFIVNNYIFIYKSILPIIPVILLLVLFFNKSKIKFDAKIVVLVLLLLYSYVPFNFYNQGDKYLDSENLNIKAAIKKRELAAKLSLNPFTKNMIYNNVAILNFRVKNYEGANIARENAVRYIDNQDIVTTLILSNAYKKNKNYDDAIRILNNKNNLETDYKNKMMLYDLLGNVYIDANAYPLALNYTNEALKIYNLHREETPVPCAMIRKRITISKKMKQNDFVQKDETFFNSYCKSKF